jgi:hypothetical protein
VPGETLQVPHYYVIKTLGDFAVTNVFVAVPALEDTLSKCLPMLGMIKMENMKVRRRRRQMRFTCHPPHC